MHEVNVKAILSAKNGMNIYRGCEHGCIYCDARSTCYNMNHDFEDIEVKANSLILLENALRRKRTRCMIGTGAMSDPYMPLEKKLEYTRNALKIIDRYNYGATILTKSDLILRDLDLLRSINEKTKCVVQMTLTTYDDKLCKLIEPGVCPSSRRFEVLDIMRQNNIPTVVWMTPILPFINDTVENIEGLLDYCVRAKVKGIIMWGAGVTLREGDREYFYSKLDKYFPGVKEKYIKTYGNAYDIPSKNSKEIMDRVFAVGKKHNIMINNKNVFEFINKFEDKTCGEQMELFKS